MISLQLDEGFPPVPVVNGQCMLEDISLVRFAEQNWWRSFHDWLRALIDNASGEPEKAKVILSDRVQAQDHKQSKHQQTRTCH